MSATDRRTFNRAAVRQGAALLPELGTDSKQCGPRAKVRRLVTLALASALVVSAIQEAQAQDVDPAQAPSPTTAAPAIEAPATQPVDAPTAVTLASRR